MHLDLVTLKTCPLSLLASSAQHVFKKILFKRKSVEFTLVTCFLVLDFESFNTCLLTLLRRHCQLKKWRLVSLVVDVVRLLVEVVHAKICHCSFRHNFSAVGEVVVDHCMDSGDTQRFHALLVEPSDSPRRSCCTSPRSWRNFVKVQCSIRDWECKCAPICAISPPSR